jgi:catechol 2,3-dioxygenase-like lactoylglutathione lyase family enzyme
MRLHHVQVAIPPGAEDEARAFYGGVLGMTEIPKPPALADRGGLWLQWGDAEIHLGAEEGFAPARKAHPAFVVDDLDAVMASLERAGVETIPDDLFPGHRRCYAADPFRNRLEFLEPETR